LIIKVLRAKKDGKTTFWTKKKVLVFQAFGEQKYTNPKSKCANVAIEGIEKKALVSRKMLCIFSPTNNIFKAVFRIFF
jgi:hypothetical protein